MAAVRILLVLVEAAIVALLLSATAEAANPWLSHVDRRDAPFLDLSLLDDRNASAFVDFLRAVRERYNESTGEGFFEVVISDGDRSQPLRVVMRYSDLNVVGFVSGNTFFYAEKDGVDSDGDPVQPEGVGQYRTLDFGVGYDALTKASQLTVAELTLSQPNLRQAMTDLAEAEAWLRPNQDSEEAAAVPGIRFARFTAPFQRLSVARALLRMVVFISEAARFHPMKEAIVLAISDGVPMSLDNLMHLPSHGNSGVNSPDTPEIPLSALINSWSALTGQLSSVGNDGRWSFELGGFRFYKASMLNLLLALVSRSCKSDLRRDARSVRSFSGREGPGYRCGPRSGASSGLKVVDSVLLNPDDADEAYFFQGDRYALVNLRMDRAVSETKPLLQHWPSLRAAGFPFVDAFLTRPDDPHLAYVFSGHHYAVVRVQPGTLGDQIVFGPKRIDAGFRPLGHVGFGRLDAALRSPTDGKEAYLFSGTRFVLYNMAEARIVLGPRRIVDHWSGLREAGFRSVHAAVSSPSWHRGHTLFVYGDRMVQVELASGTNWMVRPPRRLGELRCLRQAGFAWGWEPAQPGKLTSSSDYVGQAHLRNSIVSPNRHHVHDELRKRQRA